MAWLVTSRRIRKHRGWDMKQGWIIILKVWAGGLPPQASSHLFKFLQCYKRAPQAEDRTSEHINSKYKQSFSLPMGHMVHLMTLNRTFRKSSEAAAFRSGQLYIHGMLEQDDSLIFQHLSHHCILLLIFLILSLNPVNTSITTLIFTLLFIIPHVFLLSLKGK